MRLLSCEDCGIVYDLNRLVIPENDDYDQDDPENWAWVNSYFVPMLTCKVCDCKTPIEDNK